MQLLVCMFELLLQLLQNITELWTATKWNCLMKTIYRTSKILSSNKYYYLVMNSAVYSKAVNVCKYTNTVRATLKVVKILCKQ